MDQETEDNELHSGDAKAEGAESTRMLLPDHFDTTTDDVSFMVNLIEAIYGYVLLFGLSDKQKGVKRVWLLDVFSRFFVWAVRLKNKG